MKPSSRFWPPLTNTFLAASFAITATAASFSSTALAAPKKGAKPKAAESTETAPATAPAPAAAAPEAAPAAATPPKADAPAAASDEPKVDITDTKEDPDKRYYFVGLRYRGTIIPQFFESLFVEEGGTVYSNTFGAEIDMRKGGQSMIPWFVYTDYGMADTLFHQKNADATQPFLASNYSVVSSGLKALYVGIDELWSAPLDEAHHWDFEYGFGVGIGIVFGDLINNWVHEDANGPLHATTGQKASYSKCQTAGDGTGCATADHMNATTAKVGNYVEKNWFNGGAVPVIFPSISFPTLGIRYKPIKQLETRLQVGFSITGFWFQLSADYGLEKTEKPVKASTASGRMHDML